MSERISDITGELAKLDRDTYKPELFDLVEKLVTTLERLQALEDQTVIAFRQDAINLCVVKVLEFLRLLPKHPHAEDEVISHINQFLEMFKEGFSQDVEKSHR